MVSEKKPFYERRWFKGAAAILALVSTVWLLIGIPTPWAIFSDLTSEETPLSNTEIVLDASAAMAKPYGHGTMLEAAAGAVEDFVRPLDNEGLALRRAGGNCKSSGRMLVDFGRSHEDEVAAAAANQEAEGKSNLTYAIIAAIDDFSDSDRFGKEDSRNRIVVVTSSAEDTCLRGGARRIRREIARSKVQAVLSLVALDAGAHDQALKLATALTSSPPKTVQAATEAGPVRHGGVCARADVECGPSLPTLAPGSEPAGSPSSVGPEPEVPPSVKPGFEESTPVESEVEFGFEESSSAESEFEAPPAARFIGPGGGSLAAPKSGRLGGLRVEVHSPRNKRELAAVIAGQRHAVLDR